MKFGKTLVLAALAFGSAGALTAQSPWQGWYYGANVGYTMDQSKVRTTPDYSSTGYFALSSTTSIDAVSATKIKPTGFAVSFNAGWNGLSNAFAYGAEWDLGLVSASKTRTNTVIYPCCVTTSYTLRQKVSESFKSTLRGRLGWANQKVMLYGTGGLALANFKYEETLTDTFAAARQNDKISKTKLGWVLGLGAEWTLKGKWTMKGEYLYSSFGKISGTSTNLTAYTPAISYPTNVFHNSADLKSGELRFGVNYRF